MQVAPNWPLLLLRELRPGLAAMGTLRSDFSCLVFLALLMVAFFCQRHRVADPLRLKAIGIFVLFFLMLFVPLVWKHATNADINERAQTTWVWADGDSGMQKLMKAFSRYPGHFGPDFLFVHGDRDIALSPPAGFGLFLWDSLVWMFVGAAFLISTLKSSVASRWLIVWLVAYPAGDLFSRHVSLHALRSLPGVGALVLLAALGMATAAKWLWSRWPKKGPAIVILSGVAVAGLHLYFFKGFFEGLNTSPDKRKMMYMEDLLEASRWIETRQDSAAAVFCTSTRMVDPYVYTLIGTEYDPAQWFLDHPQIVAGPLAGGSYANEEVCFRYGKTHFMMDESFLPELRALTDNNQPDRVLFIVRPGELGLGKKIRPAKTIRNRLGEESLWVFDTQI